MEKVKSFISKFQKWWSTTPIKIGSDQSQNMNRSQRFKRYALTSLIPLLGRVFISLYFFNTSISYITYFLYGLPGFPFGAVVALPCSILVLLNVKVHIVGLLLLCIAFLDALRISSNQISDWLYEGKVLYINELMCKKFSMLGGICMVLAHDPYFKTKLDHTAKAFAGLLVGEKHEQFQVSQKLSIVLLIVRLLISSLFIFVGWGEISRQIAWGRGINHGTHIHMRPAGDGHNQLWMKVVQFSLAIPFALGFKLEWMCWLLTSTLCIESLVYWRFWAPTQWLGHFYSTHARDHFFSNVGAAGGLLLLRTFGAGAYSIDSLLQKKKQ